MTAIAPTSLRTRRRDPSIPLARRRIHLSDGTRVRGRASKERKGIDRNVSVYTYASHVHVYNRGDRLKHNQGCLNLGPPVASNQPTAGRHSPNVLMFGDRHSKPCRSMAPTRGRNRNLTVDGRSPLRRLNPSEINGCSWGLGTPGKKHSLVPACTTANCTDVRAGGGRGRNKRLDATVCDGWV